MTHLSLSNRIKYQYQLAPRVIRVPKANRHDRIINFPAVACIACLAYYYRAIESRG